MRSPRSVLYVPASRPEFLTKLRGLEADTLILDLEDGVPPDAKEGARQSLREAVSEGRLEGAPPWMIRVNAAGSPWHDADLALVRELTPRAAVLPKAEDIMGVTSLARGLADRGIATALMIETATGVSKAPWLAGSHIAIDMLIYGAADLRLSLGARHDEDRGWERHALSAIVLAARANGCAAIDSVHFRYLEVEGLARAARIARDLGFDGKSCVHPMQVRVIHEVFASTPDEIAWAERVLRAWEEGRGASRGVVVGDGELIEALHVTEARRILDRR